MHTTIQRAISPRPSIIAGALLALAVGACGDPDELAAGETARTQTSAAAREPAQKDGPRAERRGRARGESTKDYAQRYAFSEDWFTMNIPNWETQLAEFRGQPDVDYLEVGLFEGRSALWMLEQILTHPTSRLTGIDLFPSNLPGLKERWLGNLALSGCADRATTLEGYSHDVLRALPLESYDIIYIDGAHEAHYVLADATLAFALLTPGGMLIFDDYGHRAKLPDELRPGSAIDAFITTYRNYLEIVYHDYQVFVRKLAPLFPMRADYTRVGEYAYLWGDKKLVRADNRRPVALSARERELLQELLRSRPYGRTHFAPGDALARAPELIALCERLGLSF